MSVNVPEIQILDDNANQAQIKILAYFNGTTSTNTAFSTNTLFGANTSMNCIVSVTNVLYSSSLQTGNGRVSVEWIGSSSNVRAFTYGRYNDGEMQKYVINNAVNPTGDININIEQAGPNDSCMLILTLLKEKGGIPGNAIRWGAGSWANGFINT